MVMHPGARPSAFSYPFGAASRLRDAAETLLDELHGLEQDVHDALAHACVGFEGRTRRETEACCQSELALVRSLRQRLREQVGQLEDAHARARQAERRRDDEILDWQRDLQRWEQHQRQASG